MDIEEDVKKIVATVFKVNENQLTRETRFVEDLFISIFFPNKLRVG